MAKCPFRTAYLVFVWMHISASTFAHLRVLLFFFFFWHTFQEQITLIWQLFMNSSCNILLFSTSVDLVHC